MQVRQLYTDKCSLVIGAALAATPADARIRELMTQGRPAYSELITSVTSRPGRNLRPGQLSSMASGATSEGQSRLCLPDVLVFLSSTREGRMPVDGTAPHPRVNVN
jgi:hypothetical protein